VGVVNVDSSNAQQEFYDRASGEYDAPRALADRAYVRKAKAIVGAMAARPRAVVEVGAGTGLLTRVLAPMLGAPRYVAIDISTAMLDTARTRCDGDDVEHLHADVADTGLAGASFDAVVGVDIIHHLASPIVALREWKRIARPGARLAVLETNPYNPLNLGLIGVEHEVRVFLNTPANLAEWARAAGWRNVSVSAAPAYTPSGPRVFGPALDVLDRVVSGARLLRWFTALWLVTGDA
jgi:ubiquinone/menaquinone biosynthesis C-methylase UbiE